MPEDYQNVELRIREVRPGGQEKLYFLHPDILPTLHVLIEEGTVQDVTFVNSGITYEKYIVENLDNEEEIE
jgi:hypothetical protein